MCTSVRVFSYLLCFSAHCNLKVNVINLCTRSALWCVLPALVYKKKLVSKLSPTRFTQNRIHAHKRAGWKDEFIRVNTEITDIYMQGTLSTACVRLGRAEGTTCACCHCP